MFDRYSRVFTFFEEICAIPHGSGNTCLIADYLVRFAEKNGLEYFRDDSNNVIIKKEGSHGYEKSKPVILQGHTDMVCEKEDGKKIDFQNEGISILTDGDYICADKTTLGGDDGIAVAMILAILESDLVHPPIEAVFTSDEEIGMLGASSLDMTKLCGKTMINVDSEIENVLTVSCAGGVRLVSSFNVKRIKNEKETYIFELSGIKGGHSGVDIINGGANAVKVCAMILDAVEKMTECNIVSVSGGDKDNVIPNSARLVLAINDFDEALFMRKFSKIKEKFENTDSEMTVKITKTFSDSSLDKLSTKKISEFMNSAPNGVIKMSDKLKGLVQTSLNFGKVELCDNEFRATFLIRSSIDDEKREICDLLKILTEKCNGAISLFGDYPGWEYREKSRLREVLTKIFEEKYQISPKIEAIHAGLECGIFCGKIKDLDCVSIGPDILDIHTPSERLSVSSTKRTFDVITEALVNLK